MRYIGSLLILLFSLNTSAQDGARAYLDSVERELVHMDEDTLKAEALLSISYAHQELSNADSAIYYARQSLNLADKVEWERGLAYSYSQLGSIYASLTQYDTALHYLEKALSMSKKLNDSVCLGGVYSNFGMTYEYMGRYAPALENYFRSLKIHTILRDTVAQLSNLMFIGNAYGSAGQRDKSMQYYQRALELNKIMGFEYDEALLYINIGVEYSTAEDYDSALYFNEKAIAILEELGEDISVAHTIENNGAIYLDQGRYNDAMRAFIKSGNVFERIDDKSYIVSNLHAKGSVHLAIAMDSTGYKPDPELFPMTKAANLNKAIEYMEHALKMYREDVTDIMGMAGLYDELSIAYEEKGDLKNALKYYKEFNVLQDSILDQEDDKKIAEMEGEHALEAKEHELELQKLLVSKRRNERGFLIAGIVLMLAILGIIFRSYRMRGRANKLLSAEKKKSEDLLLNILPEEVAEELKLNGKADAMHYDEVTVLFTDFVGFTKAGERMTSQELVDELDTCFKAFDGITEKYNIEKIKTIGDAYLAVCGLPVSDTQHAEQVTNAAIEILQFIKGRRAKLGDKTFDIRIGIHSGDVVAGIVGVKKFAYDIWGDTVNTAARMQESSEPGKINISQTTYDLIKDKFTCTYRGEHDAKNKGMLKMYFVEG